MNAAYHYTTMEYAAAILASGLILPATEHVPANERPVVWFSRNRTWEQTASKAVVYPNGLSRRLTFPEMARVGVARFRVPLDCLLPWRDAADVIGMLPAFADELMRAGRRQGADPRDWYVSLEPVTLDHVEIVEEYVGDRWTERVEVTA